MRKLVISAAIAALAVVFAQPAQAQRGRPVESFTDEDISKAIEKGLAYLWSQQMDDGSWGPSGQPKSQDGASNRMYYITGLTALACYALLDSGVDPQEPKIAKALDWLAGMQEKSVELKTADEIKKMSDADKGALRRTEDGMMETTDWRTYSVGLRSNVWFSANKTTRNKFQKNLEKDVNWLINGTNNGGYSYITPSRNITLSDPRAGTDGDNSNGQYGQLGVWAGQRAGMEIPREYWYKSMNFWIGRQNTDGGWNYREAGEPSYGNMTAAGVATLFVCFDALFAESFSKCNVSHEVEMRAIQRGLDWFDKNFERTLAAPEGHEQSSPYYYLYGVERVGLASGYKYFGRMDWFKEGARKILGDQEDAGSWRRGLAHEGTRDAQTNQRIEATAFALLFLIRGQKPIMFNKLEYKGDWNNRPRDCANLCRWQSKALEKEVNWQIITLKSDVGEWHDAPIVYIGGSIKPAFSDEEINKLRTYVNQGGTLFVMTQCGGAAFGGGMKELYRKLFPKYELQILGADHEFYKIHGLTGGKVKFSMVHNGIRPLVLHTDDDLSLPWQQYAIATGKQAFDAASTIMLYVTDKQIKNRGANSWPAEPKGPFDRTVKIVKLKYAGNCDAEPLAMERFARLLGKFNRVKVEYPPEPVEIAALKDSGARLAILTGTTAFKLKDDDKAALKDYVERGGLVFFDSGGGSKPFGDSARELIGELLGADSLLPLPLSSPVYQIKDMTIEKVKYRRVTRARTGGMKEPRLMAVLAGDRPKVIFSQEDIVAGLVGYPSYACDGYEPESAFNVMRNLVLYAATAPPLPAASAPATQPQPASK
ncbi:MAG: DUF4159 domain-containing protein [Planctomycetes bacterium]|nr:DUF4159 domain-containing protein [Planctomycetota bacterium]